jgi:arylsulfatase A-like enzyme
VVGAAALLAACGGAPDGPPDVLLISLDTLRADRVSSYGYERPTTPTLDALAARGVLFADAVAPSSQTAPSHMSVFTGVDPMTHGVRNVHAADETSVRVSDRLPMLPEAFRAAGYVTAAIGDTGNVHPDMGFDRGFDLQHFRMLAVRNKVPVVREFCREAGDDPLFLFFHTYQIHAPYVPPDGFFGRFTDPDYRGEFRRRHEQLVGRPLAMAFGMAGGFLETFDGMGERDLEWLSDLYDEGVAWTDAELGELIDAFREERGDDALVAVFSDHGEEFYEHGRLGHRRGLTRALTRVPLILSGPGVGRGVVDPTVSLTGLATTLLELVGIDPSAMAATGPDGARIAPQAASFAAWARDPASADASQEAYQQLLVGRRAGLWEAVTVDGEHLVRESSEAGTELELFRYKDDPLGLRERGAEAPEVVERLTGRLDARRLEDVDRSELHPPVRGPRLSVERRRSLEALGYVDRDDG